MVTITPEGRPTQFVNDVFAQDEQRRSDLLTRPHHVATAAVDTTVTSLAWLGTAGLLDVDSIVPDSATRYHRSRSAFDAISSVPLLFAGVGLANKASRAGGALDRFAEARGLNSTARNALFADTTQVARYDELMQNARSAKAVGVAQTTGLTTPNLALSGRLDEGADALQRLTGAGTYEEAAQWATTMTTQNAIKQGVAQEVAIFGLLNQSEFLFPDEMGLAGYLGLGALGVGLNVGVDVAMRRAVVRKSLANAATAGAAAAKTARESGILTEGSAAAGVVGERWQTVLAGQYGIERADAVEAASDAISGAGGGALSKDQVLETAKEIRAAANSSITENVTKMFADRMPSKLLRSGFGSQPAISQTATARGPVVAAVKDRVAQNKNLGVAMAELGGTDYAARIETHHTLVQTELTKAQAKVDQLDFNATPGQFAKAQEAVDKLSADLATVASVRGGVIEQSAVLNMNPNRRVPFHERNGTTPVNFEQRGTRHAGGKFMVGHDGEIKLLGKRGETPAKLADLNFNDMTELNTLVGKSAGNKKFSDKFWGQFLNGTMEIKDLPAPILDALRDGVLKLPDSPILPPKAGQVRSALSSGMLHNYSLVQKFDWWKARSKDQEFGERPMDLFDAEKALNLRLTDDRGMPNALGHALRGFETANSNASAADILLRGEVANDGLDALFDFGLGNAGAVTSAMRDAMQSNWGDALAGVDALRAHEKPGGIGALYHRVDVPTDGELQVAKLAASRNASRQNLLLDSASEIVNEISAAMRLDSIAFNGARETLGLFHDTKVTNNTLTTTTFAHRFQRSLQHAAQVQKDASTVSANMADEMLRPVGEFARDLLRSPRWPETAPQIGGAQQLIHRGFALGADTWSVGYNKIDISRPGAQKTLDELGDLKGAPTDPDDWVMFDIAVAANQGLYIPVKLGDDAAMMLNQLTDVSYRQLDAMNALRRASGMHVVEKLNGHLPVANFSRFKLRYIEDPDTGRVIGYVKGRTDREADASLQLAMDGMNARRGNGANPVGEISITDIKNHYDAVDEMFLHSLRDFSGIKQNGTSGGRSADFRIDVSADLLGDAMVALRNTHEDLTRRTVAANFAEPIAEARMMLRKIGGQEDQAKYFNAVQQWENVLLGSDRLAEDSFAARGHALAEDFANFALGKLANVPQGLWRIVGKDLEGQATKKQAEFARQVIANHEPFTHLTSADNISNFLKAGESVDPFRLSKALQLANRGTTAAFLKIANVAHPILNYTGAVVTMPGVLKGMQQGADETLEAWQARVGPVADYFEDGIATISASKLMTEGFELVFKDPAAVEFAAKRGMIDANMLEELNKVTSFKPNKFVDAMEAVGKYSDYINTWLVNPVQKRITGQEPSAATLSERSETGTRAWIHMTGYALAKRTGGMNEAQMHSFAHYFANQNIADFSPNLRGEAFRGIGGIPFGLFQSYSINLYQRLFRYLEDGNKRALAVQMATQASMFGVSGLPGWNALNGAYFNTKDSKANEDGATTLNERIYNSLGKDNADVLMAGGLSNLPRLLGGGEAINLFSSGDANPRMPNSPALSMVSQIGQGTREGIKVAREEVPKLFNAENFDSNRFAEVLANYAPSRGHRSLTDLYLGERIDRRGNLVEEDTRTGVSLVARLLGTKTRDEILTSEAIWNNGQAQRQRVEDMGRVRNQMLRHIRNDDMSEEQLSHFLARYIEAGGNEDQWARWLNFTTDKATQTRDERALDRIVGRTGEILGHNFPSVQRLVAAGVQPTEEMRNLPAPILP